jgi:hypothetical protein
LARPAETTQVVTPDQLFDSFLNVVDHGWLTRSCSGWYWRAQALYLSESCEEAEKPCVHDVLAKRRTGAGGHRRRVSPADLWRRQDA